MKITLILATLLFAQLSFSSEKTKTIKCNFTEPFFTIYMDLEAKNATMTSPGANGIENRQIAYDLEMVSTGQDPLSPEFMVEDKAMDFRALLKLNLRGSDGMSDITYPLEIVYGNYIGGCETNKIPSVSPSF